VRTPPAAAVFEETMLPAGHCIGTHVLLVVLCTNPCAVQVQFPDPLAEVLFAGHWEHVVPEPSSEYVPAEQG
jgi:hypothetical protein